MFFKRLQSACIAFSNAWKNHDLTASRSVGAEPRFSPCSPESDPAGGSSDGITVVNTANGKRYLGILAEAERLGVSREHLWLVLSGKRESKSLIRRVRIKEVA